MINRNFILLASFVLITVHVMEIIGLEPCDLCLKQRWAWYVSLVLAIIPNLTLKNNNNYFLMCISFFLFLNAMLAAWHAGIEWGFWEGFQTCAAKENNFDTNLLETLKSSPSALQCNQASFRFLGLSLAGYNSILSLLTSLIISKNIWKKNEKKTFR